MLGLSNVVACSSCSWCWWMLVAIGARWAAGNALDGCDPYWQPIDIMPGLNTSLRMKFQTAIKHSNIHQTGTIPGCFSLFFVVLDLEDIFIRCKFCSSFWELTSKGQWSTSRSQEMALATRDHDRTHGHAMVLRWKRTLPLTDWQHEQCHRKGTKREECIKKWERENFCWEKFPFMVEPFLVTLLCDSLFCHGKDQHVSCLKALKSYCTFGLWQVCLPHPPSKGRHSRTSSFPRITCWTPKSLLTWSCCLVVGIHWDICIFLAFITLFFAQSMCFKLLSTISTRLDADAALVRHHVDILGGIAQQMQLGADKT